MDGGWLLIQTGKHLGTAALLHLGRPVSRAVHALGCQGLSLVLVLLSWNQTWSSAKAVVLTTEPLLQLHMSVSE